MKVAICAIVVFMGCCIAEPETHPKNKIKINLKVTDKKHPISAKERSIKPGKFVYCP